MQVFVVVKEWAEVDDHGNRHWEQQNMGVFSTRELAKAYIETRPADGCDYDSWEFTLDKEYEDD